MSRATTRAYKREEQRNHTVAAFNLSRESFVTFEAHLTALVTSSVQVIPIATAAHRVKKLWPEEWDMVYGMVAPHVFEKSPDAIRRRHIFIHPADSVTPEAKRAQRRNILREIMSTRDDGRWESEYHERTGASRADYLCRMREIEIGEFEAVDAA